MRIDRSIFLIIIIVWLTTCLRAQKFKASFQPYDAIGIVGGYHLKSGSDIIELGLSRQMTIHGQSIAYALSYELSKGNNNNNISGFGINGWFNNLWFYWLSGGIASAYYTDFENQRALSIRPMIGLGVIGYQVVYEYDLMLVKPNFDFGGNNRIALRINLGLFELSK